ncbi:hypothetical protein V8G54_009622 [Vigna mungo]|uniref:Chromo domain-containing protein n=1 Tax=Vigna mungo TaxID=3915 RepID=A0AAQ3NVJ4_VIGMU
MSQLIQTPDQQVYLSKLLGYDYTIQYRARKHNVVADALSRPTDTVHSHFFILSMPRFIFLDKLRQSLQDSPDFVSLLAKIWLNHDNPFIPLLLEEYHTTPLGGHMGLYKTIARIQGNFFWKGSSSVEAVDSLLTSRQVLLDQLRAKLEKAQLTMKEIADYHRRYVSFQVDDWVYVRLRPYRQRSLHSSTTPKLTKRYYGPSRITARIGLVAYQLDLPPSSKIHPVFHCSLLKLHKGLLPTTPTGLPPLALDNKPIIEPLAILDTKMDSSTSPPTKLVLVQWKGLAPEDTTWEPWTVLNSDYHLEDKVPFAAVGIDSNSPISSDPNTDMMNGPNNANRGNMRDRPSRKTKMPNYLCDYITK